MGTECRARLAAASEPGSGDGKSLFAESFNALDHHWNFASHSFLSRLPILVRRL
jgi:hypothetical protein